MVIPSAFFRVIGIHGPALGAAACAPPSTVPALCFVCALTLATPATAETPGSLFVSLTSDETHRADMALVFSRSMQDRGHPITIWLNDKGVLVASRKRTDKFAAEQKMLGELVGKGATLLVCPFRMKHYGVAEADLMEGAAVGNPDITGRLLFADGARTLSW